MPLITNNRDPERRTSHGSVISLRASLTVSIPGRAIRAGWVTKFQFFMGVFLSSSFELRCVVRPPDVVIVLHKEVDDMNSLIPFLSQS